MYKNNFNLITLLGVPIIIENLKWLSKTKNVNPLHFFQIIKFNIHLH